MLNITIGYNSQGVYGFVFETFKNPPQEVGTNLITKIRDRELEALSFRVQDGYQFVGFLGSH